jgi:hypothetical protein
MDDRASRRAFIGVVLVQIAIFVLSLPGFGVETRKASDYSVWAGPIFLLLTVLVFALGIAAIVALRSRLHLARELGAGQAVAALATNLLDISHAGGPPPPTGPLVLGILSILVALVTLAVVAVLLRPRVEAMPSFPP